MTILSELPGKEIVEVMASPAKDDPKVQQVRETVLQVYLSGGIHHVEQPVALDHANSSIDESPWMEKDGELIAAEQCLLAWGRRDPLSLFNLLHPAFINVSSRFRTAIFLSTFLMAQSITAQSLLQTPLLDALLISAQIDTSTTLFYVELAIFLTILSGAPLVLIDRNLDIYAILLRAIGLDDSEHLPASEEIKLSRPSSPTPDESSATLLSPLSPSTQSDSPDVSRLPSRRSTIDMRDLSDWQKLDKAFGLPLPPASVQPISLLSYLYSLLPCSTLEFMRDPASFFRAHGMKQSRDGKEWEVVYDKREFASRCVPLARLIVLHPDMLSTDASTEFSEANKKRIGKLQPSEIVASVTLIRAPAPPKPWSVVSAPTLMNPTPSEPLPEFTPSGEFIASLGEARSDPYVEPNRDYVGSVVPDSYLQMVKTGTELRIQRGDEGQMKRTGISKGVSELAFLRRSVLLLRNELSLEVYLKNMITAHNQQLHRDSVFRAGQESEMQSLHNKYKSLQNRISSLQRERDELKLTIATTQANQKAKNDRFNSNVTKARAKVDELEKVISPLRNELQQVCEERDRLRRDLADEKNRCFEINNKLIEAEPKIRTITGYEAQIEKLTALEKNSQAVYKQRELQNVVIESMKQEVLQRDDLIRVGEKEINRLRSDLVEQERAFSAEISRMKQSHRIDTTLSSPSSPSLPSKSESYPPSVALGLRVETLEIQLQAKDEKIESLNLALRETEVEFERLMTRLGSIESSIEDQKLGVIEIESEATTPVG
ncbi:hypothetical protein [Phaffia rhodozyma]|uniref:Uncharacterized protein n=1 Tax=Phaffia rhodozyma TaxID=264483 RepID=A0A0F7SEK5_PHARH|nr:hypothetical protein [Phaffia rhodozyma]